MEVLTRVMLLWDGSKTLPRCGLEVSITSRRPHDIGHLVDLAALSVKTHARRAHGIIVLRCVELIDIVDDALIYPSESLQPWVVSISELVTIGVSYLIS